jgi:hypothetical protein
MTKSVKKLGLLAGMAAALGALGGASESHHLNEEPNTLMRAWASPIFIPKKHTKMSYAKQKRLAKGRRNKSMYSKK